MFAGAGTNPGEKTLEDKFFEKEVCSTLTDSTSFIYVYTTNTHYTPRPALS